VLSGAGGLRQLGGVGRMVLTAPDTYTGNTLVLHGVLEVAAGASLNTSNVFVNTTDANIFSTVFVRPGSVKSLHVGRGVVNPNGSMTVLNNLDFTFGGTNAQDAVLDLQLNDTAPGQFGQITANGIDLNDRTTFLQVRPIVVIPEGASLDILVNTSNTL